MTNEIVIDPETGLPELPDDMFWRVGPHTRKYYDKYGYPRESTRDSIILLKRVEEPKKREVRVYGTKWYNNGTPIGYETETYFESSETVVGFERFGVRHAFFNESIPEMAESVVRFTNYVPDDSVRYELPISAESISFLAKEIFSKYLRDSQREAERIRVAEEKRLRDELAKDKFFGDYPPKRLGHEEH